MSQPQLPKIAFLTRCLCLALPLTTDLDTPFAVFKSAADAFPENKCLGHRAYLEDGKRGDYEWDTYAQVRRNKSCHLLQKSLSERFSALTCRHTHCKVHDVVLRGEGLSVPGLLVDVGVGAAVSQMTCPTKPTTPTKCSATPGLLQGCTFGAKLRQAMRHRGAVPFSPPATSPVHCAAPPSSLASCLTTPS